MKKKAKKLQTRRSRFMSRYEDWESLKQVTGQTLESVLKGKPTQDFFERLTKHFQNQ